ncbi:MAG: hypothetical protein WCD31_08190 [Gillisia sp.]
MRNKFSIFDGAGPVLLLFIFLPTISFAFGKGEKRDLKETLQKRTTLALAQAPTVKNYKAKESLINIYSNHE